MIHPTHFQEWVDSAIAPELISLNLKSLTGTQGYDELLYSDQLPRRNTGRLSDNYLKRYEHLEEGGWYCGTINPITGSESLWGCFKPDKPRINSENGKPIKYEHPPKVPTEAFFLRVTWEIGLKIATLCGLEDAYLKRIAALIGITSTETFLKFEDLGFWQFVKANLVPIILTEGAKKAASLLSAGYCTIALPGIWNGYRQPKDNFGNVIGLPYLIPQLEVFATQEREISFCFDHDPKPKTAQNVRGAITKTGKLLSAFGCKVSVITWTSEEKGVDDLIALKGHEYFSSCYLSRLAIEEYQLTELLDLTPLIDLTINERYLPSFLIPPKNAKIIGIRSIQGTGKTEWLAKLIEPMIERGEKVVVIVHREQLAIALAERFGIDYRTEVYHSDTKGILGYTLCVDSLHERANPPFNPHSWEGASVIIDEAEQVFWHLLNGQTCLKNRVAILKTLKKLIQITLSTGGRVYLADADLSPIAINYVKSLAGFYAPTWIVNNTSIPNTGKRKCYQFTGNDPSSLLSELIKAVFKGEKPFILTDGQKHRSKYGTRNLEYDLRKRFPHLKILRIDSESVADPYHKAYGCMGQLNEMLLNYDIVIASPTIETGVSIDIQHFSSVWVISHGVQTVDAVCQGIERVRDDIPRYIWLKGFSPNRIGSGSIDVRTLLASTHKIAQTNIQLMLHAGFHEFDGVKYVEENDEYAGLSPSLLAWAKRACVLNYSCRAFREQILKKLTTMGYDVIPFSPNDNNAVQIKEEITLSRDENYTKHCQKVSVCDNPTDVEFDELSEKRAKTEEELLKLKKGRLVRRYLTENITSDLIVKDDEGWYKKIRLHYFLSVGQDQLSERDRKTLQQILEGGEGELFKPDLNSSLLSIKIGALKLLNIAQFFDLEQEFTTQSLKEWFEKISQPIPRSQIKSILGMNINPEKDTPIAVAQRLLGLLGLKMSYLGRFGSPENRQRVYRMQTLDPDRRSLIFERWIKNFMSTPCINNEIEI
ncbi:plasmid replication protein, CyRepA1 family [Chroococcus sp. FPU101]|uniref:plasmid replication protein, CyRepA1 family n=1 Tax=Chroococcus sp. FPU101 TaxID=1974212 RepID=UPI001A8F2FEC|nr:plasmid replication protein, CyRepA1 family [Chroococcus sp. FPU101]GFE69073.1 hypothetical protein CFPU101_16830 [Chroococcus sp. FPU101]